MDSGIVISLILGGASVISSICFGLIPNVRRERISKLEKQRDKLFSDIRFFHEIEYELLNIVEKSGGNNVDTKRKVRILISEKNNGVFLSEYAKPSIYNKYINNGTI